MVEPAIPPDAITFRGQERLGPYLPTNLERRVNVYPLAENELEQLAATNSKTTLWASLASFFLSSALSLYTASYSLRPDPSPAELAMFVYSPMILLVMAGGCGIAAAVEARTRSSMLKRIKNESAQPALVVPAYGYGYGSLEAFKKRQTTE